jgi:hypothetical protein
MALPIAPVVADAHLQAQLDAVNLNLALPITEEMVHRAAECLRIVQQHGSGATDVEHGRFILFLHEVTHAQQSCVTRMQLFTFNFPENCRFSRSGSRSTSPAPIALSVHYSFNLSLSSLAMSRSCITNFPSRRTAHCWKQHKCSCFRGCTAYCKPNARPGWRGSRSTRCTPRHH